MNNHNSTVPAVTRLIEAFHRLPGVGPKTAINLLNENGDLDGVYKTLEEIEEEGIEEQQPVTQYEPPNFYEPPSPLRPDPSEDLSTIVRLKKTLDDLISNESYEHAAVIRDRIKKISKNKEIN